MQCLRVHGVGLTNPLLAAIFIRSAFAILAAKANVDKEALQRAIGYQIGSSVTDDYYISQDAHISAATEEFEKLAAEIKSIVEGA